jgi:pimeloyl-ACP methyl ester carboxylesterase
MTDYLALRGDITLAERPFNDVDNLALSTLSYIRLAGIAPGLGENRAVTVREACTELLSRAAGDITPYVFSAARVDIPFLEALAATDRLGFAPVHDCVDVIDEARSLQFSAMCVDVSPTETYVAFRGTDSSLVGWREDFMLSFEVTDAQTMAAEYLERVVRQAGVRPTGGRRVSVYVGGHSKGGNLAAYAAAKLPEELRPLIARVWSNDGPGLAKEVMPESAYHTFGERFVRLQPAYSIVGQLFDDPEEPRTYVASSATDALEHDPMTWQVTSTGFVSAGALDPRARVLDDALARWVDGVALEDREVFTNQLFDALGAGGATTFNEILTSPQMAAKTLASMGNLPDFTRQLLMELLSSYATDAMRAAYETGVDRLVSTFNRREESRPHWLATVAPITLGTLRPTDAADAGASGLEAGGAFDEGGDQRDDERANQGGPEAGNGDARAEEVE